MKIDVIFQSPKRKLNYWGMLMLIVCFFVSCGTLDKAPKHTKHHEVVIASMPVISTLANTTALDTGKGSSTTPAIVYPGAIVSPIKSDIQKVSDKVDNSSETLDSLKKMITNQNKSLVNQDKQTKAIQELSIALTRQTRKTDSLVMALREERVSRAYEKRSAEIRATTNQTLVSIGRNFPLFTGILCIIAGLFGYWLRGKQKDSFIQII